MEWWIWCVAGLVLFGCEVLTPGLFMFVFFGAGAILVAFFTSLGVLASGSSQWLFFSVFSIASLLVLRGKLRAGLAGRAPVADVDSLEGTVARARENIMAGSKGQVEQRGTTWSAINRSAQEIRSGEECRVVGVDGLTLFVERM